MEDVQDSIPTSGVCLLLSKKKKKNGSLSLVMFDSFTWVMGWDGMFGQYNLQHCHCASKELLVGSDRAPQLIFGPL